MISIKSRTDRGRGVLSLQNKLH